MNFTDPSPIRIESTPFFTSYLINELVASGLYNRALSTKSPDEQEAFKAKWTNIWFEALSGVNDMTPPGIHAAVTNLSAKRGWTDSQIKELCSILNYDAAKEIKDNPYSWAMTFRQ